VNFCHHRRLALTGLALLALVRAAWADDIDLELVLAVDASGSVDEEEYRLQLSGLAAGFRDPAVRRALVSGPRGRIAVNLLTWAEPQVPKDHTGWHILSADADAEAFARLIETLPRSQNGGTGLGEGLAAAVRSIAGNGLTASRRVIDVSGDGQETPAREHVVTLPQARAMAIGYGITVNGLAITNEEPGLAGYYRSSLQAGAGSFVMETDSYEAFAAAMRAKLLREIGGLPGVSDAMPRDGTSDRLVESADLAMAAQMGFNVAEHRPHGHFRDRAFAHHDEFGLVGRGPDQAP